MNVDTDAANTALLLDEKIDERVQIAVGRLFGWDASNNMLIPRRADDIAEQVRWRVTQHIMNMMAGDPSFVNALYERMLHIQQNRQQTYLGRSTVSDRFF